MNWGSMDCGKADAPSLDEARDTVKTDADREIIARADRDKQAIAYVEASDVRVLPIQ